MLDQIRLNDKTYNEIFQKALSTIPVLSSEWTDYNYSDPGINTLQIMSIIKLFQQSYVDKVNDNVKRKLIKLLGYDIEDVKPSSAYVKASIDRNYKILSGQKMRAGDIVFETEKEENILGQDISSTVFYDSLADKYFDVTFLREDETKTSIYVFGEGATEGSAVYLFFNNPLEASSIYSLYVNVNESFVRPRNYIPSEMEFCLSKISWQVFTYEGWKDIVAEDETKGFLQSGMIKFKISGDMSKTIIDDKFKGYVIRGILERSQYDVSPQIKQMYFNVCQVKQKNTIAKSFVFDSDAAERQRYNIKNFITKYDNIIVLAKDAFGRYIKCYDSKNIAGQKYCGVNNRFSDGLEIVFDKDIYNFLPAEGKAQVKIICYSDDFFEYKNSSAKIYGFENQIIKLSENMKDIISSDFKVMIKIKDDKSEYFYDIDTLNDREYLIKYKLDNIKNTLEILKVNILGDIELIITDCALSKGFSGNIRQNEINNIESIELFKSGEEDEKKISVRNIYPSTGGENIKTIDQAIFDIVKDMSQTHSLVTKKDFEKKIFEVPGVIIHKVKAISEKDSEKIDIIVKPYSRDKFPLINDIYRDAIIEYLDKYRLITTQINILSPVYVPINVMGEIYIKPSYKDADLIIKNFIEKELDTISGDKDFGFEIVYGDLYSKLESLSCVDSIYSFSIEPASKHAKKLMNSNIVLDKNALSYLGDYNIEISNNIVVM